MAQNKKQTIEAPQQEIAAEFELSPEDSGSNHELTADVQSPPVENDTKPPEEEPATSNEEEAQEEESEDSEEEESSDEEVAEDETEEESEEVEEEATDPTTQRVIDAIRGRILGGVLGLWPITTKETTYRHDGYQYAVTINEGSFTVVRSIDGSRIASSGQVVVKERERVARLENSHKALMHQFASTKDALTMAQTRLETAPDQQKASQKRLVQSWELVLKELTPRVKKSKATLKEAQLNYEILAESNLALHKEPETYTIDL